MPVQMPLLPPLGSIRNLVNLDFTSTARMGTINALDLNGTSQYLQASDISAYDWSSSKKWSVEFWRSPNWRATSSGAGYSRCWFSKDTFNSAGDRGFFIRSRGTIGHEDELEIYFWGDPAGGTTYAYNQFQITGTSQNWSHCIVTWDGGSTQTLKVYLDGVLVVTIANTTVTNGSGSATVSSGGVPNTSPRSTAPATIGATNISGITNFHPGPMSTVRFWVGRALSLSDVTALWGDYFPTAYASLASGLNTSSVGAWDCGESSGNRADSTANNNPMVPTATPGRATLCKTYAEKGPCQLQFRTPSFCYCPQVITSSPLNSLTALKFSGNHYMRAGAGGLGLQALSVDWFAAVRPTFFPAAPDQADHTMLSLNRETGTGTKEYCFMMYFGAANRIYLRYHTSVANSNPRGSTSLSIDTNYLHSCSTYGTGNLTSFNYRTNKAADAIDGDYEPSTPGSSYNANGSSIWNSSPSQMHAIESISVGGLFYEEAGSVAVTAVPRDFSQAYFLGYMTHAQLYGKASTGGALTTAERLAVENSIGSVIGV